MSLTHRRIEKYVEGLFNELVHQFDLELREVDKADLRAIRKLLVERTLSIYLRTHVEEKAD